MAKRFIDTDLFKKRFVRELKGAYKLLWVYLFCECDNAGILEVDIEAAELYCGHKYNLGEIKKTFEGRIFFFKNDAKAFIPAFIEFQYGYELSDRNPAHRSVIEKLTKYQLNDILTKWSQQGELKPLPTPLQGSKGTEETKASGSKRTFVKPTLEEVVAYCNERKNGIDPQQWLDHYTSNGWKVGKNPMKDWKAAVRTWEKNGINGKGNGKTGTAKDKHTAVSGETTKETFRTTL